MIWSSIFLYMFKDMLMDNVIYHVHNKGAIFMWKLSNIERFFFPQFQYVVDVERINLSNVTTECNNSLFLRYLVLEHSMIFRSRWFRSERILTLKVWPPYFGLKFVMTKGSHTKSSSLMARPLRGRWGGDEDPAIRK